MTVFRRQLEVRAPRRGLYDITAEVARVVSESGVREGMCNVFVQHTSASLCINEAADPTVRDDLEAFLDRLVPEDQPYYRHTAEGPDDMPSHIKTALTQVSLTLPVTQARLALGTWQGIFLWEHRGHARRRRILVSVW
ncbi:MAG TPA: secondary thiamine-phosphate synthase enzyme YjbQ [Candidatus Nitrosotenuis sp.]|nr:secondary thiamine-phosphate synthase enzyme YjbQ [Candidatus Nitrosotenuis sp.]